MCRISPAVILALALAVPISVRGDTASLKDALALEKAIQDAIRQAEPSIACILVSRSDAYRRFHQDAPPADEPGKLGPFPKPGNVPPSADLRKLDLAHPDHVPESFGSGVVIDAQGLILTHYHVVRDAAKIFVRLPDHKGSYADLHGADPRSDLAVLRLLDPKLQPLKPLALSKDADQLRKGQFVISLAHPFAAGFRDGSPSASWGILGDLRRRHTSPAQTSHNRTLHHYGTLLQIDARLNLGCSGGALLDLKGELIGLTTALAALSGSETAGGFAVPMTRRLCDIVDVLRQGREVEYGFLGVGLLQEGRRGPGVVIDSPTLGSPAYWAGLQRGDRLLSVNEMSVHEGDDLFLGVGTLLAGAEARLEVQQVSGVTRTIKVKLAKFHVPGKVIATHRPPPRRGLRVDHTSVLLWQEGLAGPRGFRGIPRGVCVRDVAAGSPAAQARVQVGNIITQVNGADVITPAEFYREVDKAGTTNPLTLTLSSADGRNPQKVTVP